MVDREFALASASLRQALQDMPELTEMSKHIMFEETKQGLNLEIVDQDGRFARLRIEFAILAKSSRNAIEILEVELELGNVAQPLRQREC